MNVDISEDEAAVLREALQSAVSDLRMEIADTEDQGFREELKTRVRILTGLIERLGRGAM